MIGVMSRAIGLYVSRFEWDRYPVRVLPTMEEKMNNMKRLNRSATGAEAILYKISNIMGKIKLFLKAVKSLVRKRRIASLWKSSLLLKKAIEEAEERINRTEGVILSYGILHNRSSSLSLMIIIRTGGTVINIFFTGEGSVCE